MPLNRELRVLISESEAPVKDVKALREATGISLQTALKHLRNRTEVLQYWCDTNGWVDVPTVFFKRPREEEQNDN